MCVHLYLLCCFCRGNRAVLLHYGAVNVCAASEVTAQTVTLISLCLAQQVEQGCRRFSAAHLCAAGRTHHLGAAWRRRRAGGCGRGGCSGRAQSFEMCVRDSCTKLLFARCPSAARHSHAYMQHACRGCASAPLAFPLLSARPSLPVLLMFSRPRSRRRTRCRWCATPAASACCRCPPTRSTRAGAPWCEGPGSSAAYRIVLQVIMALNGSAPQDASPAAACCLLHHPIAAPACHNSA